MICVIVLTIANNTKHSQVKGTLSPLPLSPIQEYKTEKASNVRGIPGELKGNMFGANCLHIDDNAILYNAHPQRYISI